MSGRRCADSFHSAENCPECRPATPTRLEEIRERLKQCVDGPAWGTVYARRAYAHDVAFLLELLDKGEPTR